MAIVGHRTLSLPSSLFNKYLIHSQKICIFMVLPTMFQTTFTNRRGKRCAEGSVFEFVRCHTSYTFHFITHLANRFRKMVIFPRYFWWYWVLVGNSGVAGVWLTPGVEDGVGWCGKSGLGAHFGVVRRNITFRAAAPQSTYTLVPIQFFSMARFVSIARIPSEFTL